MPLYFALKVPLSRVNLLWSRKWAISESLAPTSYFYWSTESRNEFTSLKSWKVNTPWGIISMLSTRSISWDNISENKCLGFSWWFNRSFIRFCFCIRMSFMQVSQKTLHLTNLSLNLKEKNDDLSNHGMTHRLPDRVFTEFSFAPQAKMKWLFMNVKKIRCKMLTIAFLIIIHILIIKT